MTAAAADTVDVVRIRPDRTATMEALLAGAGPHLDALIDVGTAPNGDLLLHLPAPAARLTDLLRVPGFPTRGEAVTVLVPLAQSLARLHGCGVALGAPTADAVGFDADGTPSWAAPRDPALRRRVGEEAFARAVRADLTAFRAFRDGLLAGCGAELDAGEALDETVSALFRLADPAPVRLHPVAPAPEPCGPPSRLLPAVRGDEAPAAAPSATTRAAVQLRAVRARVWVAAATAGVLLVAGIALLPSGRADSVPAAGVTTRATRTPAHVPTVARATGPQSAVTALLTGRARCLAAADEGCLRGIDATDSPVLAADLAAVRAGSEAVRANPVAVRLRSAAAGTALADAEGVTVLAVRQPDGWRLRDIVAEPPKG